MMKMLSDEEARELFRHTKVARLGCIVNGEPYVVPISCHLHDDYLYSHSLPGLKISGLRGLGAMVTALREHGHAKPWPWHPT